MGTVNLPIGASNSGPNEWGDVHGEDQAIVDVVNGNIDNSNVKASAGIVDSKLASPNNSAYRQITQGGTYLNADCGAGTYLLSSVATFSAGSLVSILPIPTATGISTALTTHFAPSVAASAFYFDDADYAVAGLTQKLRLRAQVLANTTQPAITFTFGLYPVTVGGGADTVTLTLGTVVASSTVAAVSPTASTANSYVNSDFTVPSDGMYALGVVTSAQLTNNAAVLLAAQLQTRNV